MLRHMLLGASFVLFALSPIRYVEADDQITQTAPTHFSVLLSGKVHEAFVTPEDYYLDPPLAAPKVAPAKLVEVKPTIAKELERRAVWIPGYWEWDAAAESFVWTTGIWRFPPPRHAWIEGKWTPTEDGYVRVPGHWTSAETKTVVYVKQPPKYRGSFPLATSLESDQFWVPGCWIPAEQGKFTWREGTVARRHESWVWVPAQYYWNSEGWAFVEGYWDHPLAARGQVFASLKLNDETYDSQQIKVDTFAPIPSDAISETSSGEYVYAVKELDQKLTFVSVDSDRVVELPEAPVVVERSVVATQTASIRGSVRRGALAPANIEVELLGHTSPVVTTDDQGNFEFTGIPYGVYYIRAAGPVQNHVRRAYAKMIVGEPLVEAQLELR